MAASQNSRELCSFFQIVVTAAPGHALAELDRAIMDEIPRLLDAGPAEEEMTREIAQAEAQFVQRLQTVGGFGGKSDQLNAYNVFAGDPGYLIGISAATAAQRPLSCATRRAHTSRRIGGSR